MKVSTAQFMRECVAQTSIYKCVIRIALSMQDGYIGIERETEKAYLLFVENTFNAPKCSGWDFWVAKSLLK